MDHPFFDAVAYPWDREEARQLHKLLTEILKKNGDIENMYAKCRAGLPPLTLPANADELWREALQQLTIQSCLQKLFELIRNQFPSTPAILNVIIAIETARPSYEIKIFNTDIFILDCDKHRQAIKNSTSDIAAKALLVRGDPKSGKSHCRYILQSIARDKGAEVVYLYDGIITTLQEAIENIFSALGAGSDKIPQQLSTDEAWYKAVCIKMKELATAQNKKIWIVADDLGYINGGPILDTRIRMFFEQFTLFLQDSSFSKFFRLMLINYAEPTTPTKWKSHMWTEVKANENDIQQNHVEDFLKDWAAFQKITILEQDLKAVAGEIIEQSQNPPEGIIGHSRLERIHEILTLKLDEILRKAS